MKSVWILTFGQWGSVVGVFSEKVGAQKGKDLIPASVRARYHIEEYEVREEQ